MPWALLQAMRPHQWVKNLLVFAPLGFTHDSGVRAPLWFATLAFVAFCLASSAVYLLNDVIDREADRRHPKKRMRPIASGRLPVAWAAAALVAMLAAAGAIALFLARDDARVPMSNGDDAARPLLPFGAWLAAYLLLNLAYSFRLKQIVIVDALSIALGFQFRVLAGAAAIATPASSWILLCTFFFALFLAFCKRREEVVKLGAAGTRESLRDYDAHFLDQMINPLAAMSILAYALYTVDDRTVAYHGTTGLALTVPFVVFGVFRYLYLVHRRGEGDDPARLLFTDRQLVLSGVLWAACVAAVLTYA
ncbi:MAG TPA: UbiA prenyltransferase family protein [Planctomycetota bacterium]|nr:UbiA prenyltransferase family protein [Planctomycetota bacterium]